jgi:beta-barrel assembly-enhancing protease
LVARRADFIAYWIDINEAWRLHHGMVIGGVLLILAAQAGRPPWAENLQRYDDELETVSYQLAVTAGSACPEKAPLLGLSLHDLSQYRASDQVSVKAAYGFEGYPMVLSVAAHGPAATDGIEAGDSVVAINEQEVPADNGQIGSYVRLGATWAMLDEAALKGAIRITLQRDNLRRTVTIQPVMGCRSRVELGSSPDIDALADDSEIVVNIGALDFADGEDEAAAIIAHELAHNIFHHRAVIASAPRTQRRAVAQRAEIDADRLSIDLLVRAHYDPAAILRFWQRFLTQFPKNRHDGALRKRVALIRANIAADEASTVNASHH